MKIFNNAISTNMFCNPNFIDNSRENKSFAVQNQKDVFIKNSINFKAEPKIIEYRPQSILKENEDNIEKLADMIYQIVGESLAEARGNAPEGEQHIEFRKAVNNIYGHSIEESVNEKLNQADAKDQQPISKLLGYIDMNQVAIDLRDELRYMEPRDFAWNSRRLKNITSKHLEKQLKYAETDIMAQDIADQIEDALKDVSEKNPKQPLKFAGFSEEIQRLEMNDEDFTKPVLLLYKGIMKYFQRYHVHNDSTYLDREGRDWENNLKSKIGTHKNQDFEKMTKSKKLQSKKDFQCKARAIINSEYVFGGEDYSGENLWFWQMMSTYAGRSNRGGMFAGTIKDMTVHNLYHIFYQLSASPFRD